jgi:hypothetical protein
MRTMLAVLVALAVAGCAGIPGKNSAQAGDSQETVRTRLGPPALERKLPSGDTAWFYVTGPSGFFTWRAVFGPDGRLTQYDQVLTMQNFDAIPVGASRDAVLDRLGPPMQKMTFERTATETWTYRWMDGTLEMLATAVFGTGTGGFKQITVARDPEFTSPAR